MKNKKLLLKNSPIILWRDLLDLGINSSLAFLKRNKSEEEALKELKASLFRQSEEHWWGLYRTLKRLK